MGHLHNVYDDDAFFVINATTRKITNSNSEKKLIQGDHNSERFTFEIPRFIEGHDLSLCDKVEIHYLNVSANSTEQSADVYLVDDAQIGEGASDVVIFSWLISANATKYAGTLNFLIRFVCLDGETIEYAWNTAIFDGITIANGMDNSETVVMEYSDVLEAWKCEILGEAEEAAARAEAAAASAEEAASRAESIVETNSTAAAQAATAKADEVIARRVAELGVVQSMGNSPTAIMSQKTTTDVLNKFATDQQFLWFGGDITGTNYKEVACNIPAGSYNLHIDNIETTDTDDIISTVTFVRKDNGGTTNTVYPLHGQSYDASVVFVTDIVAIRFYASKDYASGVGDTFNMRGVKVVGDTVLNKRLTTIENDMLGISPDLMVRKINDSMVLSQQWTANTGTVIYRYSTIASRGACGFIVECPVPLELISNGKKLLFALVFVDANNVITADIGWKQSYIVPANQRFTFTVYDESGVALTEETVKSIVTIKPILKNDSDVSQSLYVEYGRYDGATYNFVRIPKTSNDGKTIRPIVALTSDDKSLNGSKCSPLTFSKKNDLQFTINAGLFDVVNMVPVGQTIIDGVSITNTPMADDNGTPISDTECYPLCIDANGNLSAPYARSVDTATIIADGVKYAITGWGKLVDNFEIAQSEIDAEIVHKTKNYSRQCIGQFENGDYCVLTAWGGGYNTNYQNEAGMTYEECAQILVDHGVKFAYSLDGGGSAGTVIKKRQINPIYEGTSGRSVPSVIYFTTD